MRVHVYALTTSDDVYVQSMSKDVARRAYRASLPSCCLFQ